MRPVRCSSALGTKPLCRSGPSVRESATRSASRRLLTNSRENRSHEHLIRHSRCAGRADGLGRRHAVLRLPCRRGHGVADDLQGGMDHRRLGRQRYAELPRPELSARQAPPLSFATRTGDLLFVSGIPGFDEKGVLPDSFEAQFGFVVANIKRVQTMKHSKGVCLSMSETMPPSISRIFEP